MKKAEAPKPGTTDIEISSGAYLNLANPDPSVITLNVVAHHLSTTTRYAGAPRRPLSIGEHTLLVAEYLEHYGYPAEIVLGGLHHDDAEAFVHDVTRPLKEIINPLYKPIEDKMMLACIEAFGLEELGVRVDDSIVKEADHWALAAEAYYLMPTQGRDWWCWGLFDPGKPGQNFYSLTQLAMGNPSFTSIKQRWLLKHHKLTRLVGVG